MDKVTAALELRKALQFFIATFDPDKDQEKILAVSSVYPAYQVGVAYKIKDIFGYGVNDVGDIQLYEVLQDHTSAEQWKPDEANSLYKKIGIDASTGYPEWVQPLGSTDAYALGDIVSHNGKLWKSLVTDNVWEPTEVNAALWAIYTE